jgi:hypothetical protein
MANKKITSEEVFDPNLFATVIKAAAALRKVLEENLTTLKDISKTQAFNSGDDIKKYNDVVSQTTTNVKAFEMAQKDAKTVTEAFDKELAKEAASSKELADILDDVNGSLNQNITLQQKRKAEILSINKQQKELNNQLKAGRISQQGYTKASADLLKKSTELKVANNQLLFTIKAQIKEGQAANTSFNQQAQRLGQLRTAYRSLSEEERNSIEVGQKLLKNIKALDKQVKENDASIGNFQRNVGNYNGGIKDAIKNTGLFDSVLNKVAEAQGVYAAAQQATTVAVGKSTGALKLFKIALISTGLGAIVVALGSVVAALASSEEGTNKINKVLKALGVVVGNLVDVFAGFGDTIIEAFTNPKKALEDFGKNIKKFISDEIDIVLEGIGFIGSAIAKVFKGDFEGAAEDAKSAFQKIAVEGNVVVQIIGKTAEETKKLVAETKKELKIQNELNKIRDENLKLERQLTVATAKGEKEIAELRLKARDFDKFTADQRLVLLQKAIAKENELINLEVDLATRKNKIAQEELKFSRSGTDELNAAAEAEAELFKVQTKRLTKQKELQSEINRARQEADKEILSGRTSNIEKIKRKTTLNLLEETDKAIEASKKEQDKQDEEYFKLWANRKKEENKIYLATEKKKTKDSQEADKERNDLRKEQFAEVENVLAQVGEARTRADDQEQEQLQRKAERTTQNIDIQAQLAAQGLDNTLAESQKKQAEIELQQQELADKKIAREKRGVFFAAINAELQNLQPGESSLAAVGKAFATQAVINVAANGLASLYDGADRVGDKSKANIKGNGKDDTLVALTQEERVIGHKDSLRVRNKLGNISNKDLVDLALNNQGGVSVASMNDRNIVSGLEKVTTAVEGIQFHLNIDPNGNISKEEHRRGLRKVLRAAKRRPRLNG